MTTTVVGFYYSKDYRKNNVAELNKNQMGAYIYSLLENNASRFAYVWHIFYHFLIKMYMYTPYIHTHVHVHKISHLKKSSTLNSEIIEYCYCFI